MTKAWEIKWHRISHRWQNLALNVVQNESNFLFLWPGILDAINCLVAHSVALVTTAAGASCAAFIAQCKQEVAQMQLPRGSALQTQKAHHLGAWAVLEVLWKPSEVKGEKGNKLTELMWFLTAPICPKHAAKAGCEPLARSPTFPDKALCLRSRIRAPKVLHHWIL